MQMKNDYSGRNFTTGSLPFLSFGHEYKKFLHLNLNGDDGIGKDTHPSLFLVITKEQDNPKVCALHPPLLNLNYPNPHLAQNLFIFMNFIYL